MSDAMARFKTRALFNSGVKIYLTDPTTGEQTDEWLQVRNRRSDAFRAAAAVSDQQAADTANASDEEKRRLAHERGIRLAASLVSGWSFDAPCTEEGVAAFLADAEQVAEQIMATGISDEDFFAAGSKPSTAGPKKKSRS